ncbi:hypothetical protein [Aestuariirhabdus haliotis]|uniref:hypothetical protein n=1 Tax=Aestuariirhabdus haliotis TaxID=2918751 RepID=UPI00201B3867|nr:hypothetical protein [Aestuariirhabdus haliotis]
MIHSIILSYSEDEPYLNFLSMDDIEAYRETILAGTPIHIDQTTFNAAEEAYSAVGSLESPQALQYFAKISHPVMLVLLFVFLVFILAGS